jgi:catechol 2,3-dioxygenase-like lactoylglutathione lyase family enzyme
MQLKAIVFKTARLNETRAFFETVLGMKLKECSRTHFVIHGGEIRILFVESDSGSEAEFYVSKKSAGSLTVLEDPNHNKVIVIQEKSI